MKKILFWVSLVGSGFVFNNAAQAQCCTVITSNGVSAATSNGVCATLAYLSSAACDFPLDSDGDGVIDKLDKCPTVKGLASNNGCPAIPQDFLEAIEDALKNVTFETDSDVITSTSYSSLERVVKVLSVDQNIKLKISGHTDNSGDHDYNMSLSQKRADAVKKYIAEKGIDPLRMTAVGYGETLPIAGNDTAEERAKNRRVEFNLFY